MNATKRKFNSLINGLGNKSTTSLNSQEHIFSSTESTNDDQASKKRRVVHPTSATARLSVTQKPGFLSSTNVGSMHKKATSIASSKEPDEPPTYAPWDRNAFLERLKTFSNLTDWTDKPERVNEVQWAKRGWICKGFERVRCCSCHIEILVKLNKKDGKDGKEEYVFNPNDIEQALVDKYAELILTSHADNCLWRQRGCDDSIFKLPLNNPASALKGLRERYDSLDSLKESLPYTHNMHPPAELNLEEVMRYLPSNFFATVDEQVDAPQSPEINHVALMMALFGWQRRPAVKYRDGACWCPVCFRTLGLWLFKSKSVNEQGEEVDKASVSYLDPLMEHRYYCPWKNAESQSGKPSTSSQSPELAAWQVLIRVIKNDHTLRHAQEAESRKSISGPQLSDSISQVGSAFSGDLDSEDARSIREQKDKDRWARLRRVKSLFDTKSGKKLQRQAMSGKDTSRI